MTKDRLESILKRMAKDSWSSRLIDVESGDSWCFSNVQMACEPGFGEKGLPKDIGSRQALIIETEMPDDSMIEAQIKRGDRLRISVGAAISSGDVVLVDYNKRSYIMAYFKDSDGMKWYIPRNFRYASICGIDDDNPCVVGRLMSLDRYDIRVEYDECVKQIEEVKKKMETAKVITQDHATWAIKQIESVITVKRWWFPIYRALVQKKLTDEEDYEGFCERIKRDAPDNKALPEAVEIRRQDVLGFRDPIEKWTLKTSPLEQPSRFVKYKELGLRMIDLLEWGEESAEEILRKLSDTLKKNNEK